MAGAKLTPAQQRDRRSKRMLAVLGVVLLAVLGFQIPKLMKGSGSSPTATPTVAATTAGAALAAEPIASQQLDRFTHFAPKNPFNPRVKDASTNTTASTTTSSTPPAPKPKPTKTKPNAGPTLTFAVSTTPTVPQVPAALVLIDGKKHTIALGASFPAKHPMFKLLALSQKALWIQLIGGSLSSGSQTLKLDAGRKVLLENTTAGVKVALKLVRATTAPAPDKPPAK